MGPAQVLSCVLHVRAYRYLPAATADIRAFFAPLVPARVGWLNAESLNVFFEDDATAARALELAGEPVAAVPSVFPVHPAWRTCLKPLIKQRKDKYAPAGAETSIWLRRATTHDTKANAAPTHGAGGGGGAVAAQKCPARARGFFLFLFALTAHCTRTHTRSPSQPPPPQAQSGTARTLRGACFQSPR